MTRRRLDQELVRRGLAESREAAQDAIAAGIVTVSGAAADKAARMVAPDEPVRILAPPRRYVSRGGDKLEAALESFGVAAAGKRCVDVGASTGGFTDCLLEHDASVVYAIDVGYGQLHAKLRGDDRVVLHERVNCRNLTIDHVGGRSVDVCTVDVSFISLRLATPPLHSVMAHGGDWIFLVKPQFEATRAQVGKGGIVADPAVWKAVLERLHGWTSAQNVYLVDVIPSPIRGTKGNVEFLAHLRKDSPRRRIPLARIAEIVASVDRDDPGVGPCDADSESEQPTVRAAPTPSEPAGT